MSPDAPLRVAVAGADPMLDGDLVARRHAAESVARDAGALALRYRAGGNAIGTTWKGPHDVVTEADDAVERFVVASLRSAFPDDAYLGEEGGGAPGDHCWVIDPIDGTANYARGLPQWCVSIAFVAAGRTEIGVIYEPTAGALYSARRGAGASRNGAPIRVSGTTELARATVDVGYSHRTSAADFGRMVVRLLELGANVTQCGSAAVGLARVADGRIDGYAERHLYAWDALAGLLLVAEAGGRVNAFLDGGALTTGNETIAATPALYQALASALGPPRDRP